MSEGCCPIVSDSITGKVLKKITILQWFKKKINDAFVILDQFDFIK